MIRQSEDGDVVEDLGDLFEIFVEQSHETDVGHDRDEAEKFLERFHQVVWAVGVPWPLSRILQVRCPVGNRGDIVKDKVVRIEKDGDDENSENDFKFLFDKERLQGKEN